MCAPTSSSGNPVKYCTYPMAPWARVPSGTCSTSPGCPSCWSARTCSEPACSPRRWRGRSCRYASGQASSQGSRPAAPPVRVTLCLRLSRKSSASARSTSVPTVSPARASTTPTDHAHGLCTASSATSAPALVSSVFGSTRANSSPPSRAMRSSVRSRRRHASTTIPEQLVARRVALGVVDHLEVVQIDHGERHGALARTSGLQVRVEDLVERAPGGHTGEIVCRRIPLQPPDEVADRNTGAGDGAELDDPQQGRRLQLREVHHERDRYKSHDQIRSRDDPRESSRRHDHAEDERVVRQHRARQRLGTEQKGK